MKGHAKEIRPGVWKLWADAPRRDGEKRRQVTRTIRGGQRDADTELAKLITEITTGKVIASAGTLGDLFDRWLPRHPLEPRTRDDYTSIIRVHIRPALGHIQLHKLRASDLDAFYDRMGTKVGPARVRKAHTVIRSALQQAVRWQEIPSNIAVHATPPSVPTKEIQAPTPAEVVKLFDAANKHDPGFLTFVYVAQATGARAGEVCGLKWRDVDWPAGELVIARNVSTPTGGLVVKEKKERNPHRVGLDHATLEVLKAWRLECAEAALGWGVPLGPDAFVFARDGRPDIPWRPGTAGHRFIRLRAKAGLPHVQLRQLRHYVGTQLFAHGVDPVTVSHRLGHKRRSTSMDMYAAWQPSNDRAAAELLGRLLKDG